QYPRQRAVAGPDQNQIRRRADPAGKHLQERHRADSAAPSRRAGRNGWHRAVSGVRRGQLRHRRVCGGRWRLYALMAGMLRDPLLDFSGRRVLITGAASGFGALLAQELAARGASLVLGDIQTAPLETLAATLRGQGASVVTQACDVSAEADCRALVEAAVSAFGGLDMAV